MVTASLLAFSLRGDGGPGHPVPSVEARLRDSKVVAVVRIESGETEVYSDQIYKARVTDPIKGAQKDDILYFWAGNIGREGYSVGEIYLVFLRLGVPFQSDNPKVADAHVKWRATGPESRFPQDATLYSTSCPHSPIVLRYQSLLDRWKPVFFLPGGCVALPEELHSETVGARGEPFLRWVAQDSLLSYLKAVDAKTLTEPGDLLPKKLTLEAKPSLGGQVSKVPLAEWLPRVQFIGLGRVTKAEIDTLHVETLTTVQLEETWWGKAPESVAVGPRAYPRSSRAPDPISEGQPVVVISLLSDLPSRRPILLDPIPVVRLNGINTFRLEDNLGVSLPPSLFLVPRWTWGPIKLDAFRDALGTLGTRTGGV